MRTFAWLAVFAAAFLVACTATRPDGRISPESVKVELSQGHGSGFYIGDDLVFTAKHVVTGAKSISVRAQGGKPIGAEVLWTDDSHDVALLKVAGHFDAPPMGLECRTPVTGELITAHGNPPFTDFISFQGHVSGAPRKIKNDPRVTPADLTVVSGMSGGPVFDHDGDVIGMVIGHLVVPIRDSNAWTGLAFIIPADVLCDLLARKA